MNGQTIKSFRYLNSQDLVRMEGPLESQSGQYREMEHGVAYANKHGTIISMIPWGRIIEVWYT